MFFTVPPAAVGGCGCGGPAWPRPPPSALRLRPPGPPLVPMATRTRALIDSGAVQRGGGAGPIGIVKGRRAMMTSCSARWRRPRSRLCGARCCSAGPSAAGRVRARLRSLPAPQAPALPLGAPRVGASTRPSRTGAGRRRSSRHLCLSGRCAACARRRGGPQAVQHAGGAGGHQQARH